MPRSGGVSGSVAVVYVRQSRHKPGQMTVSPEVQEQSCRALAAVAACEEIVVYRDLDLSGGKMKGRRGFLAMLERIRAGGVTVIAVYDQSRSFRNTRDALEFYAFMGERLDIKVVFVHGSFDRSAIGGFTYTNLAAAHELERRMVGEKMRDALRFLAAQGHAVGAPPFGYRRVGAGLQADIEEEPEAAAVVRRIFRDYAAGGTSSRRMARRLNGEGVPGPAGRGWSHESLQDMLINPVYAGMTYSGSRRRHEGELMAAKWPAIIDRDLWEAVQAQRKRNTRRQGGRPGIGGGHAYVYARLLVCADCGRAMNCRNYKVKDGQRYVYYKCRGGETGGTCGSPSVREDRLIPWGTDLFERIDTVTRTAVSSELERVRARPRRPEDAIRRINTRLERITELYAMGHWDKDRYLSERTRLEASRRDLEGEGEAPRRTLHLDGVLDGWRTGDPVVRRALLAALFEELYVRDAVIVGWKPRSERAAEVERLMDEVGPRESERAESA